MCRIPRSRRPAPDAADWLQAHRRLRRWHIRPGPGRWRPAQAAICSAASPAARSALSFLGDGRAARVLAASAQWARAARESAFRFGGIARPAARIDAALARRLARVRAGCPERSAGRLDSARFSHRRRRLPPARGQSAAGRHLRVLDDRDGRLFQRHIATPARPVAREPAPLRRRRPVPASSMPPRDRRRAGDGLAGLDRRPPAAGSRIDRRCAVLHRCCRRPADGDIGDEARWERATAMLSRLGARHARSRHPRAERQRGRASRAGRHEWSPRPQRCALLAARGRGRRTLIDCGSAGTAASPPGCGSPPSAWAGSADIALVTPMRPTALALRHHRPLRRSRSSPAWPANMPAGSSSATASRPWARARRARCARVEEIYRDIGYADEAETATLVIEADGPPPPAMIAHVARGLPASSLGAQRPLRADPQPGRQRPDRCPLARGRPAQGPWL